MQQAKEFIQDHLGENITIKRIADHVYMNPTYFFVNPLKKANRRNRFRLCHQKPSGESEEIIKKNDRS
ncbi:hypothetical protein GCM10020331_036840 [Ectobacillus funiculus]